MMLEGSNQSTALTWVREDLDKHLDRIRQQLEVVAGEAQGTNALVESRDNLRQLKFTFDTLMLNGASGVLEEMAMVCDLLRRKRISDREAAFRALMDAAVVLPSYLDRLQAGHLDLPILLLPVINDLRATYGAQLMSESTLFAPNLDVDIPELDRPQSAAGFDESFIEFATRMRREYENALLGWLQKQAQMELLSPFHSVSETLQRRLRRHDLRRLWWIAGTVIAGLMDGAIENSLPLRRLFARLHLNLKNLSESGERGTTPASVNAVSQGLLFHIAEAETGHTGVDLLRQRFHLKELVPDRDALLRARGAVTGRNKELFVSLGAAVGDELAVVKDVLDLELRTGDVIPEKREQSLEALSRLEETLHMLGLNGPAKAMGELLPALQSSNEGHNNSAARESTLMALAQQLLTTESLLAEHIETLGEPLVEEQDSGFIDLPAHEMRRIRTHLLDETVVSLQNVQEAVRQRFDKDPSADFRTGLNHIAGAVEMIGETEIGELSLRLRDALQFVIGTATKESGTDQRQLEAVTDAVAALELYLAGCRDHQDNRGRFLKTLRKRLDSLPDIPHGYVAPVVARTRIEAPAGEVEDLRPQVPEPELETETPITLEPLDATDFTSEAHDLPPPLDNDMSDVFLEEFESVSATLADLLPQWSVNPGNQTLLMDIRRCFHTLKGSGRMVGADETGDFAWKIEEMLNALLENRVANFDDIVTMVRLANGALPALKLRLTQHAADLNADTLAALASYADRLSSGQARDWNSLQAILPPRMVALLLGDKPIEEPPAAEPEIVVEPPASEITLEVPAAEIDPTLQKLMRKELRADILRLDTLAIRLSTDPFSHASEAQLRAAHTIAGTLALAPMAGETDVAKALKGLLHANNEAGQGLTKNALKSFQASLVLFKARLAHLDGEDDAALPDGQQQLIMDLRELTAELSPFVEQAEAAEVEPGSGMEAVAPGDDIETVVSEEHGADSSFDDDITHIFLEEATEVLERADSLLNTWRDSLGELKLVQNLQREIHTFKGGARMAGLLAMGDFSHAMESLLEQIAGRALAPSVAAIEALEQGCDRLHVWCENVRTGSSPDTSGALALFRQQVSELQTEAAPQPVAPPEIAPEDKKPVDKVPPEIVPEETKPAAETPAPEPSAPPAPPVMPALQDKAAQAAAARIPMTLPSEEKIKEFRDIPDATAPVAETAEETTVGAQIRVDADLLDSLINSAGEVSILRSHLEQQVGTIRQNLGEVEETVTRLREQLRKLEIETETQILSRFQGVRQDSASGNEDDEQFDPLEMDRFSTIQQLSRGLSESVDDMMNLQEILDDSARRSENLLLQQSRISTELQEDLMKTRMVPFGSVAPRLRRLVRTAAREAKRKARLQLRMAGSSDQLDRNILERITVPLEHMIRNAIVHGIETPAARKKLKKRVEGKITITVESEATEFVIRMQDDGSGINFDAIRKKAIKQGLLNKNANPTPQQLINFILESGFTTSTKVTGLAGRGVGMDVVNNEIKQIGGSLEIHSEPGKGSLFTIRIPFTLAVMQAIGVMAGENSYLIPLASVSGVARIPPDDYRSLVESTSPEYEFAAEKYPVMELEPLLGGHQEPLTSDYVSLLLVSAGEFRAAFRVSKLLGHREIVIKPVGPQISSIPGILGGTITANGRVVVILDAGPLIRHAMTHGVLRITPIERLVKQKDETLVMVVDDSITMRKVTSRVLKNNHYEVITARDGMDALEQLQDRTPDMLLLDVEMPRMDGFELARKVRADTRLRDIPIVMITSRAGQKHQDRAREAGANDYLTKPYKEADLLAKVADLLGKENT